MRLWQWVLRVSVGAAVIFVTVWQFNAAPIAIRMWPQRNIAIVLGTAMLLLIATVAASIGNIFFPVKPCRRGVAAFFGSYLLCAMVDWCGWSITDLFITSTEFWPRFATLFGGFEYGLIGSLFFTFPITGCAAVGMTLGYVPKEKI